MHRATQMLEQNSYVRCLMIDFSKALDSVDHVVLMSKLVQLNVLRGGSAVGRWTCDLHVAGSIPGGFHVTQVNSALHPSGVAKSSTCFGWG